MMKMLCTSCAWKQILDRSAKAYCQAQNVRRRGETRKSALESAFQKRCGLKDDTVGVKRFETPGT